MIQSSGTRHLKSRQRRRIFGVADAQDHRRDIRLVAYRGGQPLLTDLIGNDISAGQSVLSDYLESDRAGLVKIIGVTPEKRSKLAPDIPTFKEKGFFRPPPTDIVGFFVRGRYYPGPGHAIFRRNQRGDPTSSVSWQISASKQLVAHPINPRRFSNVNAVVVNRSHVKPASSRVDLKDRAREMYHVVVRISLLRRFAF